jgi:hypothetical protein
MGFEEYGVGETFGDPLLSGEKLIALEASHVCELLLVCVAARPVRFASRVKWTPRVRFLLQGIGLRTNRVHKCLECRVDGGVISAIAENLPVLVS